MSKIFLNYRRDDTAAYAGRLYDRLAAHFGADEVFMDIDRIQPGEDFVEAIEASVGKAHVVLVLIGPSWLTSISAHGRRLDNPEDFVRLEVCAALNRKIRVIPLLVGGASMPRTQDLPEPMQPLARRHAVEIDDVRFHADVNRLIAAVESGLGDKERRGVPERQADASQQAEPERQATVEARTGATRPAEVERQPEAKQQPPERRAPMRSYPLLALVAFIVGGILIFVFSREAESPAVPPPAVSLPPEFAKEAAAAKDNSTAGIYMKVEATAGRPIERSWLEAIRGERRDGDPTAFGDVVDKCLRRPVFAGDRLTRNDIEACR